MGENNDKTIALLTLGCKLNYAETGTYARGFTEAGLRIVPWSHGADVYVVNTCSVTGVSDAKSRNLVRKVHRINPSAIIVVTGCSAQLRRSDYESLPGVARVFGSSEKHLVVPETLELLGTPVSGEAPLEKRRFATPPTGSRCPSESKLSSSPTSPSCGPLPLMEPRVATVFPEDTPRRPPTAAGESNPNIARVSGTTRCFSEEPKTRATPGRDS